MVVYSVFTIMQNKHQYQSIQVINTAWAHCMKGEKNLESQSWLHHQHNISSFLFALPTINSNGMVAYFYHQLSDKYVDLYVLLSDLYDDLLDPYVDLSLIHLLMPHRYQQNYLTSLHK